MHIPRIYHPQTLTQGEIQTLSEQAGYHLARVLKMNVGEPLFLFDGSGDVCEATIATIKKNQITVTLGSVITQNNESPLNIHLGQALVRGEKMDLIFQKAVELGVYVITPLLTEHGNTSLSAERLDKKMAHWQGIMINACEQCGRNTLPILHEPQSISSWLQSQTTDLKLILHPTAHQDVLKKIEINSISLAIGPEGGFSDLEIKQATQYHFQAAALGPRILRTETAGLAMVAVLQYMYGDFRS